MDSVSILLIIAGIVSIAMAIFGRIRPDIVYKNQQSGNISPENRQRFGFIVMLLMGIMFLMIAVAMSVPQWEEVESAVVVTIALAMTVVMLFPFWKFVLSQIEGFRTTSLVLTIIASLALIALCVYYWHITLK